MIIYIIVRKNARGLGKDMTKNVMVSGERNDEQ